MKIGLILPGTYWYCPYVKIYEDVLKTHSVEYEIISWNRDGLNNDNVISFNVSMSDDENTSRLFKLNSYLKYRKFIKNTIKKNKYDKLIIFGPHMGILLYKFLKSNYSKNFFLDYRDVSVDQFFKRRFKKLIDSSCEVAISSEGFKKVLPKNYDYLISHNFRKELLSEKNNSVSIKPFINEEINISTIGAIRDYEANLEVINALKINSKFQINFIGKGSEVFNSLSQQYKNIICRTFYKKEEEPLLFINSDFVNIYYPDIISHSTALSNRFYNALIYKRPMIVTANSTQGEFVEKYNLGLSVQNCDNLDKKINTYIKHFLFSEFSESCDLLIEGFLKDYSIFEKALIKFIK